ncbi:MAG: putative Ig domain-containing protein [Agarilytica sp.]
MQYFQRFLGAPLKVGLLLAYSSQSWAQAVVTYDGTDGVGARVVNDAADGCVRCHSVGGDLTGVIDVSYAPISSYNDLTTFAYTSEPVDRVNEANGTTAMPPAGYEANGVTSPLSTTLRTLFTDWVNGGELENAAPYITQPVISNVGKTGFTVTSTVNENGANTSFQLRYRETGDLSWVTVNLTSPAGSGGGGSDSNDTLQTTAIANTLACDTEYEISISGSNTAGSTDSANVTQATFVCNDGPQITSSPVLSAIEYASYSYQLTATDLEDDALSYTLEIAPEGMTINENGAGLIEWTPTNDQGLLGTADVRVVVTDDGVIPSAPAVQEFSITIEAVNDPPVITSSASTSIRELNSYSYQVEVSDPDDLNDGSGALTFSLSGEPTGMTISSTGLIEWVPPEGTRTSGEVTATVADGGENSATVSTEVFTIEVIEFNTPPTITTTAGTVATEDELYQYQLSIDDIDDPNDGTGALSFELANAPIGMSINNTGLISWTPLEGVTTSGEVTISVTDGQEVFLDEEPAAPAIENFTVAVNRVNDAPVILSSPITQVAEDTEYRYQLAVSDPDDDNNGTDFSFSLSGEPEGMTISNSGLVLWQTDETSPASSTITITVADGLEDEVLAVEQVFTLLVNFDIDSDGITNDLDNCRNTANAGQEDNDLDGDGDVCDDDDDNDSMSDAFETENGFDPLDPSDAELDSDGDGESNAEEFANGGDPNTDDVPPSITAPQNILKLSTGYETYVDLGTAVATDALTGPLTTSANRVSGRFRTGRHIVTWNATDAIGNSASTEQIVDVIPQISIEKLKTLEEGQTSTITVALNGEPVRYPVTVDYTVSGNATDLEDGTLELNEVSAEIEFSIPELAGIGDGEETTITLSNVNNAVLSQNVVATITAIVESDVPHTVNLEVSQAGTPGLIVTQSDGLVIVSAFVLDPNASDTFSYSWATSDNAIVPSVGVSQSRYIFDPSGIAAGVYTFEVSVSDDDGLIVSQAILVRINESPVADLNENGIDDSIDMSTESFILQTTTGENENFIETENGVRLAIGDIALRAQSPGSAIDIDELETFANGGLGADTGTQFDFNGGLFDFTLSGLYESGQSVTVVIPQISAIPAEARYQKFINGAWQTFVEDGSNALFSAASDQGVCPAPGSQNYQNGLIEGDDCVQLLIEDGGPNDADGEANGSIKDPGGVALVRPSSGSSSGGGGAMQPWLIFLFFIIFSRKYAQRKNQMHRKFECRTT